MGRLYIETAQENGRTVVKDSFFTSPFKHPREFSRETATKWNSISAAEAA